MTLSIEQQFSSTDVEVVEKRPVYNGFFKVFDYQLRHKLFAGDWSPIISREVTDRGHAVAMLPYDAERGEFVMIEQFRVGALATSEHPWLLEIVAGMIAPGESEEEVCCRESQEEAGITVHSLVKLCDYLPSPGGCTERLHVFMGLVDANEAQGIHGLDTEHEDILVHKVKEQDALQMLLNNQFDNSATIVALQWFFLRKQELMAQLAANKV